MCQAARETGWRITAGPQKTANVHSVIPWYKQMNVRPTSTQVLQRERSDRFQKKRESGRGKFEIIWGHSAL